ncbi:MAG: type II toxin-antitoxin system VapC family toxin [Acidobacteria bacterium]|nr:type II toxin-antitoxin system VapC family toxin [Acidobacteriota bacterium]
MATTLVDSNVLFDFLTEDDEWFDWSSSMIKQAADGGTLVINPVIYAEVSVRYERMEDLDEVLPAGFFLRVLLPWEAAFLAGKCFTAYRRRGGTKRSSLPDFFIGAHAAVAGMTLLTRDPRRYRTYFPKLKIVSP